MLNDMACSGNQNDLVSFLIFISADEPSKGLFAIFDSHIPPGYFPLFGPAVTICEAPLTLVGQVWTLCKALLSR